MDPSFGDGGVLVLRDLAGPDAWDKIQSVTLDAQERILLTGTSWGMVLPVKSFLIRLSAGGQLDSTFGQDGMVTIDAGWVFGSRSIALADEHGVHIFDFDTGEALTSVPVPGIADIHWLTEDLLLLGTQNGAWATVSLATEDLIASARAGVTRSFTPEECATYRIDPCPTLEEMQARS